MSIATIAQTRTRTLAGRRNRGPLAMLGGTRLGVILANFYMLARRHPYVSMLGFVIYLAGIGLLAPMPAAGAEGPGPIPTGFGDLLKGPTLHEGTGATLYENYPMTTYYFDTNRLGPNDVHHVILNSLASLFMFLTTAVVRGAIVLTWWMFDFGATDDLAQAITGSIGAVATSLMAWLLPSALAIGALVAYSQTRGTQAGGLNQILWVLTGGLLAVSFAVSPNVWVGAVTDIRTIGSNELMNATSGAITETDQPFKYDEAQYDASEPTDTMLRKSADSIWRTYVVTPWCIGEFGSAEACSRYGKGILDVGTDAEKRSDWIEQEVEGHPNEYDSDAAFYRWTAGKNSVDRLGISVVAFLVAIIFAVLIIAVAATATMAFIGAIFLLFAGVVFTMLWCIPGRLRSWGNTWLETLFGLVIQSVLGTLLVGATLVLVSAAFRIAGTYGWGLGAGLSILVAVAAFGMKRTFSTIMQALTPGRGMTTMLGAMAIKSTTRLFTRGAKAVGGGAMRGLGRGAGAVGRGAGALGQRFHGGRGAAAGPTAAPSPREGGADRRYRTAKPLTAPQTTPKRTPKVAGQPRPSTGREGTDTRPQDTRGRDTRTSDTRSRDTRPQDTRTSGSRRGVGSPRLRDNPPAAPRTRQPSSPRTERPTPSRSSRPAVSPSREGMLKPRRDPLARNPRMAPRTTTTTGGRK